MFGFILKMGRFKKNPKKTKETVFVFCIWGENILKQVTHTVSFDSVYIKTWGCMPLPFTSVYGAGVVLGTLLPINL